MGNKSILSMKKVLLVSLLLSTVFINGCIQDEIYQKAPTLSDNFLPLKLGQKLVYQLDTIYFSIEGKKIVTDSVQWIGVETITDTSRAQDGRLLYHVLLQKYKPHKTDTIVDGEVKMWEENNTIIRQEGNLPYIKMQKEINIGTTWDPNALFDAQSVQVNIKSNMIQLFPSSAPHLAEVQQLDQFVAEDITLDSVIYIGLVDEDDNLIEKRYCEEKYAVGIGLVEKNETTFNTQCRIKSGNPVDCIDLPWHEKAEEGYKMRKYLLSWK